MLEDSHRRFIKHLMLAVLVLALVAVLLNRAANPYCLFATDWLPVHEKPETFTHLRLVKAMQVRHQRPQSLILGSSRAETGLDPAHPAWQHLPVYNLGLSDARLHEIKRYFQHACAASKVRQAVLLLDFTTFLPGGVNAPDFREERLAPDGSAFLLEDYLLGLCSWDATSGSLNTLLGRPGEKRYLPDGSRDARTEEARVLAKGGARKAFLAYERRFMTTDTQAGSTLDERELQTFREILDAARMDAVDLRLAVAPVHARYLEMLDRTGLGDAFEKWKRVITQIVGEEALRARGTAFPLLDFSGCNEFTTEPVPEKGLARYYLECSHFTKPLGDKLLTILLGATRPNTPGAFGYPLTSADMESHLKALRAAHSQYRLDHAEELRSLPTPAPHKN